MRIEGQVTIESGKAVLRDRKKKIILIPFPRGTELPKQHTETMGMALFAYLHNRKARLSGDLSEDRLFNARVLDAPKKIRDVPLVPESKDRLVVEIEGYFRRGSAEVARALNFIGIKTVSAFYHRLKGSPAEPPALSQYLNVPVASLDQFLKSFEADSARDSQKRLLITAPPRFPVARGVNVRRLLKERGVRATRKSSSRPPAFPASETTLGLPSAVDLRKRMTEVRNQGQRGTCVAHTAAAMLEYELIRAKKAKRNVHLSEQYIYWACKKIDGAPNEEGTFIEYAAEALRRGVPVESMPAGTCRDRIWRYNAAIIANNEGHDPIPKRVRKAPRFAATSYKKVQHDSISKLKSALADEHCVGLSVFTYHFWNDPYVGREGVISLPVGIQPDGAHAICLVGYVDDDSSHQDGYFIFKNSWSTVWGAARKGDPGYGSLPYRYVINEAIEAWFFEL